MTRRTPPRPRSLRSLAQSVREGLGLRVPDADPEDLAVLGGTHARDDHDRTGNHLVLEATWTSVASAKELRELGDGHACGCGTLPSPHRALRRCGSLALRDPRASEGCCEIVDLAVLTPWTCTPGSSSLGGALRMRRSPSPALVSSRRSRNRCAGSGAACLARCGQLR